MLKELVDILDFLNTFDLEKVKSICVGINGMIKKKKKAAAVCVCTSTGLIEL